MKAYRKTDNYTLYLADAWEVLDSLPENSIDAVVTDPPYEIGFMNKGWDNTGVAFDCTTWEKVLRILKPGGHILAFNHSRTFHRMAVAIEDAGFEIRDTIMWLYGSGFPKSHDISKAIDKNNGEPNRLHKFTEWMRTTGLKAKEIDKITNTYMGSHYLTDKSQAAIPTAALWKLLRPHIDNIPEWVDELVQRIEAEREVVGNETKARSTNGKSALPTIGGDTIYQTWDITTPATEKAKQWEGWGTALKPAYEPILLARKPIPTTVADNVLTHGVGGLNIDECRVGTETIIDGRFPANIIHDGSEEVTSDMWDNETDNDASRYYYTAKASKKDRDEGLLRDAITVGDGRNKSIDNAFQRGETPRRNIHPTVKPTDLMQYLIRLIAPKGATVLDLFMGSGSTGKAAMIENVERDANYHFIGIDRTEEYMPIAEARIEFGLHYLAEKPKADGVVHTDQIDLFSLL
jgi:DNA modification methylase